MLIHFLAHLTDIQFQLCVITLTAQNIPADAVKAGSNRLISVHLTGTDQSLMLPGPGAVLLVIRKCLQRADQHPGFPGWPQTGIHLIQHAG